MTRPQLLPKAPKRKRQPTAACMREQLALAANEIVRLNELLGEADDTVTFWRDVAGSMPRPWWRRLLTEIAETPMAELPSWARIIKAFQRKS